MDQAWYHTHGSREAAFLALYPMSLLMVDKSRPHF